MDNAGYGLLGGATLPIGLGELDDALALLAQEDDPRSRFVTRRTLDRELGPPRTARASPRCRNG